jgi:hypothetical protein
MAWLEQQGRGWRVRWYEGGRGRAVGGFSSREEAAAYASGLDGDEVPGETVAVVTLGAWAAEWFDVLKVNERTERLYRDLYRRHIEPRWGGVRIDAITSSGVDAWVTELERAGCVVATVRSVLSAMLADAVGDGLIPVNPVQRQPAQRAQERCVAQDWRQPVWAVPHGG